MVWIALFIVMLIPATAQALPLLPLFTFLGTYGAGIAAVASIATTVVALTNQPKFPSVPVPGDVEAAARAGAAAQVRQREARSTQTVFGGETFLQDTVVIQREPLGPVERDPTEVT